MKAFSFALNYAKGHEEERGKLDPDVKAGYLLYVDYNTAHMCALKHIA